MLGDFLLTMFIIDQWTCDGDAIWGLLCEHHSDDKSKNNCEIATECPWDMRKIARICTQRDFPYRKLSSCCELNTSAAIFRLTCCHFRFLSSRCRMKEIKYSPTQRREGNLPWFDWSVLISKANFSEMTNLFANLTKTLTGDFMWTSANVKVPIKVQSFWAVHFNQPVAGALEVLVAVVVMRVVIPVNLERVLVGQCYAVWFTRCWRIYNKCRYAN